MIIFGWRTRVTVLFTGMWQCPVCHAPRVYRCVSLRRWFTLFFIPTIPLGKPTRHAECTTCGLALRPEAGAQYEIVA